MDVEYTIHVNKNFLKQVQLRLKCSILLVIILRLTIGHVKMTDNMLYICEAIDRRSKLRLTNITSRQDIKECRKSLIHDENCHYTDLLMQLLLAFLTPSKNESFFKIIKFLSTE